MFLFIIRPHHITPWDFVFPILYGVKVIKKTKTKSDTVGGSCSMNNGIYFFFFLKSRNFVQLRLIYWSASSTTKYDPWKSDDYVCFFYKAVFRITLL